VVSVASMTWSDTRASEARHIDIAHRPRRSARRTKSRTGFPADDSRLAWQQLPMILGGRPRGPLAFHYPDAILHPMASYVVWKESFSVGNAELDTQHKSMFELLSRLYDNIEQGQSPRPIEEMIEEAGRYAERPVEREKSPPPPCWPAQGDGVALCPASWI
jgi:hypothetical protein